MPGSLGVARVLSCLTDSSKDYRPSHNMCRDMQCRYSCDLCVRVHFMQTVTVTRLCFAQEIAPW